MTAATTAFRDPENTAFRHEGSWYRIATTGSANALDSFRRSEVYEKWVERGQLVTFHEATSDEAAAVLDAFRAQSPRPVSPDTRVFRVQEAALITYPWEWPDQSLVDAGRLTLDLRDDLLDLGLDLKDASALNVQFRGMKPFFVDLGSIETWRPNPSWNATRQFVEHFVNPLALASSGRVSAAEAWQLGGRAGLRSEVARSLLRGRVRFRPSLWLLQASTQPKGGDAPPAESAYATESSRDKGLALKATRALSARLRRQVEALSSGENRTTWSDYGPRGHYAKDELQQKIELSRRFIQADPSRGRLVLDVGGNDGLIASELLDGGAERVVVLDGDSGALDRLRAVATHDPRIAQSITPVLGDLTNLAADSGLLEREFSRFADRVRPSAVLCQAVLHHVVITQGVPMHSAVEVLASFAAPLQIEFACEDDPKVHLLRSQIPNWAGTYSTDVLLNSLSEFYEDVTLTGQTAPTRVVVEAVSNRRPA